MKRLLFLAAALAACGDTSSGDLDQLNLDRPVDIAFACFGDLRVDGVTDLTISAQPLHSCDVRSGPRVSQGSNAGMKPVPPGQEGAGDASYYAFVLQSAPGTVALAKFDSKPSTDVAVNEVQVLDTDVLTPGKNGLSIGEEPIAIANDSTGCYTVTANAGSCDMSVLDVSATLSADRATHSAAVTRTTITNAAGQVIDTKPAAMVSPPETDTIGTNYGTPTAPLACPLRPQGITYIAYPSCHLVAAVDLSTSKIVGGIQYDANGVATMLADGNVSCPSECEGGDAVTPGIRPVALDLEVDTDHNRQVLVIGADNSPNLTIVEVEPTTFLPQSVTQLPLENTTGKLGVTAVALSPVIGMGGTLGIIDDDNAPGGQFQFVYAVATDGTVRVADILQLHAECDTQVDPRFLHDETVVRRLSCLKVGDPATPPRRAGARGPGIELTGDAIPTSVDIFRVSDSVYKALNDSRPPGTPTKVIGYYAIVTASNGGTYVVTIDDDNMSDFVLNTDPIGTQIPLVIAHQLRDGVPDRGLTAEEAVPVDPNKPDGPTKQVPICDTNGPDPDTTLSAGARSATAPVLNVPPGTIASEKVFQLPTLRGVLCMGNDENRPVSELGFAAPVAVRDLAFPDLRALHSDETWTLTWEGPLSADSGGVSIDGPPVREGMMFSEAAAIRLEDQTKPFCDAGVEPFDIVQLRGCDPTVGDTQCSAGYRCVVHPQSQIPGLGHCMLADEADRLTNACQAFMTSIDRYTVGTTTSGAIALLPRKVVLRTTPLDGCVDDNQCQELANYAQQNGSAANPEDDMTPAESHTWKCEVDSLRAPVPGTGKRCIQACDTDADCFTGRVCQGAVQGVAKSGRCMEGVIPPQACINAAQRYELRAGEAFTVLGTLSGFVHPIIADAAGKCIRNPNASQFQIGRIPLVAPACDPTANPRTGQKPDGTFEPNPCMTTVDESEFDPNYQPGTCKPQATPTVLGSRQAPAIRFQNRGILMNLVDPVYPGDKMCIGDRGGTLSNVPLVFPLYQIAFRQVSGFTPLTLPIQPSFPIKVVRGPQESIWVIDEGDQTTSTETTRGRVYRVESFLTGAINLLQ